MMAEEFTVQSLADHKKVSTKTIRRWLKDGLEHFKRGRVIRISEEQLRKFERQNTVRS